MHSRRRGTVQARPLRPEGPGLHLGRGGGRLRPVGGRAVKGPARQKGGFRQRIAATPTSCCAKRMLGGLCHGLFYDLSIC